MHLSGQAQHACVFRPTLHGIQMPAVLHEYWVPVSANLNYLLIRGTTYFLVSGENCYPRGFSQGPTDMTGIPAAVEHRGTVRHSNSSREAGAVAWRIANGHLT